MDFVIELPVRLTKMVHIAPTYTTVSAPETADLLLGTVIKYHGVPSAILSDRDTRFTSHFWTALMKALGTELKMATC